MWVLLARLVGFILYVVGLIYLTQRNCERPPQLEGAFMRNNVRLFKVIGRMVLPLLWPVTGWMLWRYLSLPAWQIIVLSLLLPLWLICIWLWVTILKPTLLYRFILFLMGIVVLIMLFLAFTTHIPSTLLLIVTLIAPYLFMYFMLRYWTVKMFPVGEISPEGVDDPEPNAMDRQQALRYLIGFFTTLPRPATVAKGETLSTPIQGHLFLGTGPGLVITQPDNIVAVRASTGFRRFIGPGAAFTCTEGADIPYAVMDLQKQFRSTRIDTLTRDGVLINVPCSSIFKINIGGERIEFGEPWPYRAYAAYLALHAGQEVNPKDKTFLDEHESVSWKELPLRTATPKLEQLVAQYTLDEIYGTKQPRTLTQLPRGKITKELRTYVSEQMDKVGISVLGGGVGAALNPKDDKIVKQRIDTWKAGWAEKLVVQEGKARAAYLKESERVRVKILNELIEFARELGKTPAENKIVLLSARLLEMLENIARDPKVEPLVPEQTMSYLEQEQRQTTQGEEE